MNRVLECEELKANVVILDFLQLSDEKIAHSNIKTNAERTVKPTELSQFPTLAGKHTLTTEPSSFIFCKKFDSYVRTTETSMNQFNMLTHQLTKQLKAVSETIS